MESQGLYCFMLFYLKGVLGPIPGTDDHVLRTIIYVGLGSMTIYEDDDRMTYY